MVYKVVHTVPSSSELKVSQVLQQKSSTFRRMHSWLSPPSRRMPRLRHRYFSPRYIELQMHKRQWGWLLFELNKIKLTERMLGQKGIFRELLPQENRTFKEAVTLLLHCFQFPRCLERGKEEYVCMSAPGGFLVYLGCDSIGLICSPICTPICSPDGFPV